MKLPSGGNVYFNTKAQPGNSGGPILNKKGEVISVVSGIVKSGDNATMAINVELIPELVEQAKAKLIPARSGFCDAKEKIL